MRSGTVFDVQRCSFVDGPGIRTTVFLKGCNLACAWCHNPESQSPSPQVLFYESRCSGCKSCAAACPAGACGEISIDRGRCTGCGICAAVCPAGAKKLCGKQMTSGEVFGAVEADKAFYETSGGGVTFSGGEPLLQADFVAETAALCQSAGISAAVDTAGCVPWESFAAVLGVCDLFLFDVKAVTEKLHIAGTGTSNRLILENLARLVEAGARVHIRVPVVGGFNDSEDEMQRIKTFLNRIGGAEKVELLPYHALGENKYRALGRSPMAQGAVSKEKMARFNEIMKGAL